LGAPVVRPCIREAGTLGAAILAGVGVGVFRNVEEGVAAMVRFERTFEPNPAQRPLYQQKYEQYKQLWPLLGNYLKAVSR
jgi:sugar (pentulose or hexulose) kinase